MSPAQVVASATKWGKAFWADLGERVGTTFLYSLITLVTMDNVLEGPDWNTVLWPVLVLPTLLSILKGLLANMKDSGSGASLLDSPPGPVLDDRGEAGLLTAGVVLLVGGILLAILTVGILDMLGWVGVVVGIVLIVLHFAMPRRT